MSDSNTSLARLLEAVIMVMIERDPEAERPLIAALEDVGKTLSLRDPGADIVDNLLLRIGKQLSVGKRTQPPLRIVPFKKDDE